MPPGGFARGLTRDFYPGRIPLGRGEDGLHEAHAFHPLGDAGHQPRGGIAVPALQPGADLLGQIGIKLGEGFDISLGKTGGKARGMGGRRRGAGAGPADAPRRLAIGR